VDFRHLPACLQAAIEDAMVPLSFASHDFYVIDHSALFWPAQKALLVADLHLEKASWFAKFGQPLPPYDSLATLTRLEGAIGKSSAQSIYCLGDNFHDDAGEMRIGGAAGQLLRDLTSRFSWVWITGNHDMSLSGQFGGKVLQELMLDGIMLRHQAEPNSVDPEMSGHYHPKYSVTIRGRTLRRTCFVRGRGKLLFPAFGALTGGMAADHPAIVDNFPADSAVEALIAAEDRLFSFPLDRKQRPKVNKGFSRAASLS
jgi:DNA ligase-associated metallophosphoesterase